MLDHWFSSLGEIQHFLPYVSFVAGLSGSLHCVGMCGGLVTASCSSRHDIVKYQLGRLLGYLSLGLIAGVVGQGIAPVFDSKFVTFITALLMGGLFIYWGVTSFSGKKTELPMPKFLSTTYQKLWSRFVKDNHGFSRSFLVGLISIMLPCGLLYGVVITTFAMGNFHQALFSMLFFWLGTLPAMVMAPAIVQKLLRPLKNKLPKFYAVGLILIGLATIYSRLPYHHSHHEQMHSSEKDHQCH